MLIARHDLPVQVWRIKYKELYRKFDVVLLVEGTEREVREYMDSEIGYMGAYTALSEDEVRYARKIGIPIYIALQI